MLIPVRTDPPVESPVAWADADRHLRLDGDETQRVYVESLIAAWTAYYDGWSGNLGRALVTQTWRQDFRCFGDRLSLPLAPVQSIASLKYYDVDGAQQTLSTDVYELLADALGPYVARKPSQSWPALDDRAAPVSVTFVAGYGAAADVPADLRHAILMCVAHAFERREAVAGGALAEVPLGATALSSRYRRVGF